MASIVPWIVVTFMNREVRLDPVGVTPKEKPVMNRNTQIKQ